MEHDMNTRGNSKDLGFRVYLLAVSRERRKGKEHEHYNIIRDSQGLLGA